MIQEPLASAQNIIRQNPSLIWYSRTYEKLEKESIAEAIFNYGTWQEFLQLKEIFGVQSLAEIFTKLDTMTRCNLLPIYRNYFRHYFKHYA